ncbi:MAG: tetratricopeptide repeat protein [Candidatus Schekmanbacteria bacterium]|nr:tetratricopeptide repeat protein [Candidatus Schekmanbacteria bacterium]
MRLDEGSPASAMPERIGPYAVAGRLGAGGMGTVYRGIHVATGAIAALKVVKVADMRLLESIRREIQALRSLCHPGIVRVVDDGVEAGMPWYAMQLVVGVTLGIRGCEIRAAGDAATGNSATLPSPRAVASSSAPPAVPVNAERLALSADAQRRLSTMVARLCGPLAYLHGEGIVHGDLKPANIIVSDQDVPVIVDFGMARWTRHVRAETDGGSREALEVFQPGGTLQYIAPEVLQNRLPDGRADLYALGCILYELLTGRPPFVGTQNHVIGGHLRQPITPPSRLVEGLASAVEGVVMGLLQKNPRHRIGYAEAVAARLRAAGVRAQDGIWSGAPLPRTYLYRPGFHGRRGDVDWLKRQVDKALISEQGGFALIRGESGIGKTRLVVELARHGAAEGMMVLTSECPDRRAVPLGGLRRWLQVMTDYCRSGTPPDAADKILGKRARVLADYEPTMATLPGLDRYPAPEQLPPKEAQLRLYAYLAEALKAFSEAERLLLIIDDLQWADELTLGFLDFAVRGGHLITPAILIVGTCRSEHEEVTLSALAARPGVSVLELGRLDQGSVAEMTSDMLSTAALSEGLAKHLMRHSEGNPFFVAEYLYAAAQEGLLVRDGSGDWRLAAGAISEETLQHLGLPSSLQELVRRRLQGLTSVEQATLAAAAVLGREARAETVRAVARLADTDFRAAAHELMRRQVLQEADSADSLRFCHDKLREVAHGELDGDRRKELHRRAAEVLTAEEGGGAASDSAGRDVGAARLGEHWEQAGEAAKALSCYVRSARLAADRFANSEAISLLLKCVALTPAPSAAAVELHNELGRILVLVGRLNEALAQQERAVAMARQLGAPVLECTALHGAGLVLLARGEVAEAERTLEAARAAGLAHVDRPTQARLLTSIGNLRYRQYRMDEAEALYQGVLARAIADGDRRLESEARSNLGTLQWGRGALQEAEIQFGAALSLARSSASKHQTLLALFNLGVIARAMGRRREAADLLCASLVIAREIGDIRREGMLLSNLGTVHEDAGDLEEARESYTRALRIFQTLGSRWNQGALLINIGSVSAASGALEAAEAALAQALAMAGELADPLLEGLALVETVRLRRRSGHAPSVLVPLIERAVALFASIDRRSELAEALCERGHVCLASGESAAESLRQVHELVGDTTAGAAGVLVEGALRRLCQAQAAYEAGRELVHGDALADRRG